MRKEEDSLLMFLSMEKPQDLESCRDEKPKQVVKEQLQIVEEEAEGVVSMCPMFWICVAAGFLVMSVVSGAYQFGHPSFLHSPQFQVELLPVYEVPFRTNDQVLDGFLDELRLSDRVGHADEYQGEAILHDGRAYLTSQHSSDKKGVVARPHSVGRLLHSQVVRMKHRGPKPGEESVASFQATFVFSIENNLAGREATGDGFAFVMVPDGNVMGSAGGGLGVMDLDKETHHTFAVEFDTWRNPSLHDISNNHVGVNVNSMVSVVAQEAGYWASNDNERRANEFRPLDLTSGKIQAWIDYDGMSQELTVKISPILGKKPYKPLLRTNLDLSKVFNQYMSVGFSAATGDFAAKHIIHGWQFEGSSTLQHWRSANNVNHEQVSVLPTASDTYGKPQFFRNREFPRGVSNLPVFRNPHKHRHRAVSTMSRGPVVTTVLPASVERIPMSGMNKLCSEFLPDFSKMDLATFKEHFGSNSLWIVLGLASAVLFIHLLFIAYHILVGCYDTCLDYSDEALGMVYQRVLDETDEESDDARYVLVVTESHQSENRPPDRV